MNTTPNIHNMSGSVLSVAGLLAAEAAAREASALGQPVTVSVETMDRGRVSRAIPVVVSPAGVIKSA
jgi:hypothetical protein